MAALQRLPRQVPLKQAMGMLLTGRHVSAQEGYEIGFVTAVVPHGDLMQEARRWAAMILECSPMSVRATKQAVMRSLDVPSVEMAMRNMNYPAYVALADERGHDRRPEGLRRETQAGLEGAVTSPLLLQDAGDRVPDTAQAAARRRLAPLRRLPQLVLLRLPAPTLETS